MNTTGKTRHGAGRVGNTHAGKRNHTHTRPESRAAEEKRKRTLHDVGGGDDTRHDARGSTARVVTSCIEEKEKEKEPENETHPHTPSRASVLCTFVGTNIHLRILPPSHLLYIFCDFYNSSLLSLPPPPCPTHPCVVFSTLISPSLQREHLQHVSDGGDGSRRVHVGGRSDVRCPVGCRGVGCEPRHLFRRHQ